MVKLKLAFALISIFVILCLNSPFTTPVNVLAVSNSKTNHDPISISSNQDLLKQAQQEGWSGNGTKDNPIIIENLHFLNPNANGISIQNTNLFVLIQNCNLFLNGTYNGIYLFQVQNLIISDTTIVAGGSGVYALNSEVSLYNNIIENTTNNGIELNYGKYNLEGNLIRNNEENGVNIAGAQNSTFTGNFFINNSDLTNISIGKFFDSLYLAGCSDCVFVNNTIQSKFTGIQITNSNDIEFTNNTVILNNNTAIETTSNINNLTISNNYFFYSSVRIGNPQPINNLIIRNNIFLEAGLFISASGTNIIEGNIFSGFYSQVSLMEGSSGNIIKNNCFFHTDVGISILGSSNNNITGNYFGQMIDGEIYILNTYQVTSINNIIFNNVFTNTNIHLAEGSNKTYWDNGKIGNFWGDYHGNDSNTDGIGDSPAIHYSQTSVVLIDGANFQGLTNYTIIDNFPLMNYTLPASLNQINQSIAMFKYLLSYLPSLLGKNNNSLKVTYTLTSTSSTNNWISIKLLSSNIAALIILTIILLIFIALPVAWKVNNSKIEIEHLESKSVKPVTSNISKETPLICPNCNNICQPGEIFCKLCGSKL